MEKKKLLIAVGILAVVALAIIGYSRIGNDSQLAAVGGRNSSCVRNAPAVTLAPLSGSGYPNQLVDYQVTVRNNDTVGCGGSQFWTYTFPEGRSTSQLYGSAGYKYIPANTTINMVTTLIPPVGTVPGDQRFGFTAGNQSSVQWGTSNIATHTVLSPASDAVSPTAPGNLRILGTSLDRIFIKWDPATDAETGISGYTIYNNGQFARTIPIGSNSYLVYADSPTQPSTQFNLTLKAFDFNGNYGPASNVATTTTLASADVTAPTAPTNVTATNITANTARISWSPATDSSGIYVYAVYPAQNSPLHGTGAGYCRVEAPGTSCVIGGLSPGTQYSISVSSYDLNYNKKESASLRFRTAQ